MVWVIVAVLGLVLLVLLVLLVPLELTFGAESNTAFRRRVRVRWLFGLVTKELGGRSQPSQGGSSKGKGGRGRGMRPFLAMLRTRGFVRKSLGLARGMLREVRVEDVRADLRVGLDDPAETAWFAAAMYPVAALADSFPQTEVSLEPDFLGDAFEAEAQGTVRVVPLYMVPHAIAFLFSRATFRAFRAMRRARKG